MIYVVLMVFIGLIIGGAIFGNIPCLIIGIIGSIVVSAVGIIKKYNTYKTSLKTDYDAKNKTGKITIEECFDSEYDFENYSMFDFSYFVKNLTGDYNHPFERSLKKVLEIEKIDFKTFVLNFDFYYNDFAQFNFQDEVSKKYSLKEFFEFFELYLNYIKSQELSIEGFWEFLKEEALTQKIYKKNKVDEDENIATAIYNGKRPVQYILTIKNIIDIRNLLEFFLQNEGKDVQWLADNISSRFLYEHPDLEEKYKDFNDPSLEDVLNWFFRYCK